MSVARKLTAGETALVGHCMHHIASAVHADLRGDMGRVAFEVSVAVGEIREFAPWLAAGMAYSCARIWPITDLGVAEIHAVTNRAIHEAGDAVHHVVGIAVAGEAALRLYRHASELMAAAGSEGVVDRVALVRAVEDADLGEDLWATTWLLAIVGSDGAIIQAEARKR